MDNPDAAFVTLPRRGLITVSGAEAFKFLQNLITNDLTRLQDGNLLYACLLTPQGKFLHDFFIRKDGEAFLLDCEGGNRAQDLAKKLRLYKLRSKVEIAVSDEQAIYAVFPVNGIYDDPRHSALGSRVFAKPPLPEENFSVWDEKRIKLAIADGSRDAEIEKSTLAEVNMADLAVAYDKGCYVGQELTARMHLRGLAKKGLYPVVVPEKTPDFAELRSSCRSIGLALIKHETAATLPKNDDGLILL